MITEAGNEQEDGVEGRKVVDEESVPDAKMMLWSATHILRQKVGTWTEFCAKKDGRMEGERGKDWPFGERDNLWKKGKGEGL